MAEGTDVIHCRLSPDLVEQVDAYLAKMQAQGLTPPISTRSGLVRLLLVRQLNEDPHAALATEVMAHLPDFLQQVSTRALEQTLEALPGIAERVAREVAEEIFTTPRSKRRKA